MQHRDYDTNMPVPSKIAEGIKNLLGNKMLTPAQLSLCDEYAAEVLGNIVFAPWLYLYTCRAGEFREGWIPGGYFHTYVSPAINGEYGRISKLSGLPKKLFDGSLFPDVLYYINGLFFDIGGGIVKEKDLVNILFNNHHKRVFFKLDNSSESKGIYIYNKETFNLRQIKSLGNGLFQHEIKQHEQLNEVVPNSVATLRLITVINKNGNSCVKSAHLRIGRLTDQYVTVNTQINIPVDLKTGNCNEYGYFKNFETMCKHPDTEFVFKDFHIPHFNLATNAVERLHNQIPYVQLIGWDVAIDNNDEVKLMEWNAKSPGITFIETTTGPCFKGLGWENLWKESQV